MASKQFMQGKTAAREGRELSANPYITGVTTLGAPRLSEDGVEWANGWNDGQPARRATKKELADAASLDIAQFRRKPNRFYR